MTGGMMHEMRLTPVSLRRFAMLAALLGVLAGPVHALPEGFVHLAEVAPDVVIDARYAGDDNFVGRPVDGYRRNTVILTRPASEALAKVSETLACVGLGGKVVDGDRP